MKGPYTHNASSAKIVTGTSTGAAVDAGAWELALVVTVTAASGTTPTLDLTIEWSPDNTNWAIGDPPDAFTQITTTKAVAKRFTVKSSFYRVRWTITGTSPSFTFDITAHIVN